MLSRGAYARYLAASLGGVLALKTAHLRITEKEREECSRPLWWPTLRWGLPLRAEDSQQDLKSKRHGILDPQGMTFPKSTWDENWDFR